MNFSLNILTLPDPKKIKGFLNKLYFLFNFFFKRFQLGHPAVTKSLIRGLRINKFFFHFNDYKINKYDICWVLAGVETLKYALNVRDKYKFLVVGPNVVNMPNNYNNILIDDRIDLILVPSTWIKCAYAKYIKQKSKIVCWYSGVNEKFFRNKIKKNNKKVLIYFKTLNYNLLEKIRVLLNKNNINTIIIKYGNYKLVEFKKALSIVDFAIFISQSESQGIALAESWSMNVPTFVWNKKISKINNVEYEYTSAAPYLTSETGYFFCNIKQLEKIIKNYYQNKFKLKPRKWILNNMTDKQSVKNVLSILNKFNKNI